MLHLMPCLSWIVVSGTLTSTAPCDSHTMWRFPTKCWALKVLREGTLTIPCLEKVTIFDPYQEDHCYHCHIKFLCIEGFQANTHASCRIKFLSASARGVHKRNSEEAWRVWWTWGAKCPAHGRNMCRVAPACNCWKIGRVATEVFFANKFGFRWSTTYWAVWWISGRTLHQPMFSWKCSRHNENAVLFFFLISAWFMKPSEPSRLKHGQFHDVWLG